MKHSPPKISVLTRFTRSTLIVAVATALVLAPLRLPAQSSTLAATQSLAASSPSASSAPGSDGSSAETSKSDEDTDKQFLYSPAVKWIAGRLHLSVDMAVVIFLVLNFTIIFLLIVVPLGRLMPKVIRKRSQTLSHDLRTARDATADAQARLSAIEAKLAGFGEEIQKFRTEVEQEAQEDEKRIKASIAEESARIVAAAQQEIGVAVSQAKRGLRTFAADLAIEHAAKQVVLTPETDRALINEFIAGVAADGSGRGGKN